jgi:hypothetical protein
MEIWYKFINLKNNNNHNIALICFLCYDYLPQKTQLTNLFRAYNNSELNHDFISNLNTQKYNKCIEKKKKEKTK